jgi:hypothetical protein
LVASSDTIKIAVRQLTTGQASLIGKKLLGGERYTHLR